MEKSKQLQTADYSQQAINQYKYMYLYLETTQVKVSQAFV